MSSEIQIRHGRHRDRFMPAFYRVENQPDVTYANIDKLRIRVNRAYTIAFSSIEDYNSFKRALGQTDVFSQGAGRQSSTFTVCGAGNLGERWLFSGTLKFRPTSSGASTFKGALDLKLNPSRYINHIVHSAGGPEHINPEGFVENFMARCRPHEGQERCLDLPEDALGLDRNDNLIPYYVYNHMRPALDILDRHLRQTLELIRQQINEALSVLQPRRHRMQRHMREWSVSRCEVYWEYSVTNAIAFINGLRGFFMPMFRDAEAVEHVLGRSAQEGNEDDPDMAWRVERNAPSLRLNLGSDDIELIIYAKTWNRVRFEIRYKRSLARLLNIRTANLPASVTEINALLEPAIENARLRLQRVFHALPDLDYSERCEFQMFVEFLARLAEAAHEAGIPEDVRNIVSLLASNGSIEVRLDGPEHALCMALERQRILRQPGAARNTRGFRRFCLDARYSNVMQVIAANF